MGNDPHPGPVQFIQRMDNLVMKRNKLELVPLQNPCTSQEEESFFVTEELVSDLPSLERDQIYVPEDLDLPTAVDGDTGEDILVAAVEAQQQKDLFLELVSQDDYDTRYWPVMVMTTSRTWLLPVLQTRRWTLTSLALQRRRRFRHQPTLMV